MPLDITKLKSSPGLPGAGDNGPAASGDEVASLWAAAVGAWAAAIVPASTTVAAAQTALETALASLFSTPRGTADLAALATSLESAHLAFANTVGGGMTGYTFVPPPGQVGFSVIITDPPRDSSQEAADDIADALDMWMKTGVSTLIASPFTVVPWS